MRVRITEAQKNRLLNELSSKSAGVKEFLDLVKETPGLLKHLGFSKHKNLEEYVLEATYKEFQELKKEADVYVNKK